MIQKNILFLLLLCSVFGFSQNSSINSDPNAKVLISEKKTGKRIVLVAENTTKDTLNIFLMVTSEGYRRSASRPVIKDLIPYSKTPVITLIALSDMPSSYSYNLIVNDDPLDLSLHFEKEVEDIEDVILGKLILFSEENCPKCTLLTSVLKSKRVSFRNFNIKKDPRLYQQFIQFIEKRFSEKKEIRLPVIWNKEYVIFGYDDMELLLNEL